MKKIYKKDKICFYVSNFNFKIDNILNIVKSCYCVSFKNDSYFLGVFFICY